MENKDLEQQEMIDYYNKAKSIYKKSNGNGKLKKLLNMIVKNILKKVLPYELEIEGIENIPDGPVIYANSHQDFNDVVNSIFACPTNVVTLNNVKVNRMLKMLLNINGVVYVDRTSKESKNAAKEELIECINRGESVNLYPEGTWNRSPNKLHLPLFVGMIEISKRTGVPVIPVAQDYQYEYNDKKELIVKKVIVKFGEPLYVKENEDSIQKLEEFDERLSTIQWELLERQQVLTRKEIDDQYYTDLILKKEKAILSTGADIEEENQIIYGAFKEFYDLFPINEVDLKKK